MEINNGLSIGFIPAALGDRPPVPAKENLRPENETATTQQAVVTVSETERQTARQQFDQQNRERNQQREQALGPDQAGTRESRALQAYQQTQANDEDNYLSQILGFDGFA